MNNQNILLLMMMLVYECTGVLYCNAQKQGKLVFICKMGHLGIFSTRKNRAIEGEIQRQYKDLCPKNIFLFKKGKEGGKT